MVIRYMLDTDACIALIKNRPVSMRSRLSLLTPEEVGISSIVAAELWFGVAKSQKKKKNESALKDFLEFVTLLDWPCEASPLYGQIRATASETGNADRRHGSSHCFSCPVYRYGTGDKQHKGIRTGT